MSISIYSLFDVFDPIGGNAFDVDYGPGGVNAVTATPVGAAGLYRFDVTSLVTAWLADPAAITALALSGIYGNDGADPFNSYAIFHTVGTTTGLVPAIQVTPLPAALPLLAAALLAGAALHRRAGRTPPVHPAGTTAQPAAG